MAETHRATARFSPLAAGLRALATLFAYLGGAVIAGVGLMSAASIVGRSLLSRPIQGDYELVEIGIAVAGSLFLPYCQATRGHIIVDFFTLRAGSRAIWNLDRIGSFLMAVMFLAVGWRTLVGTFDIARSGETSMLMSVPVWIGYAFMVPGVLFAGLIAVAQSIGIETAERRANE
jgi:TRAP-type C4-dicarboxylate transport system permease small subunit